MTRALLPLLSLALYLGITGCGDDAGGGAAPTISDLNFTPQTLPARQTTTVSVSFEFTDPDADVVRLWTQLNLLAGQSQTSSSELEAYAGQSEGRVGFVLGVTTTDPGTYGFEVWLEDAAENLSDRLSGTLPAE